MALLTLRSSRRIALASRSFPPISAQGRGCQGVFFSRFSRQIGRTWRHLPELKTVLPNAGFVTSHTIKRAEGVTGTVLHRDITAISGSGLSLMPEGMESVVNVEQMADLIAFLLSPQ